MKTENPSSKATGQIPIVAIGASAGGQEAITDLLLNLPPKTGMAYVYIQHLKPTRKSMLSSILSKVTSMPVQEASHLLKIKPDHLYIIPPEHDLSITGDKLKLIPRHTKGPNHLPIDSFFFSLAKNRKDMAIGVVLSGNAADGALGLKAIKMAGGLTFVQDDSAKYEDMPLAAISEGVPTADYHRQRLPKKFLIYQRAATLGSSFKKKKIWVKKTPMRTYPLSSN